MTKLKGTSKALLAVTIASVLALGGALSAQAITATTAFSTVVPRLQQSYYWQYQNRTTANPSQVTFDFIGSTYLMNVKSQNGANQSQYTEKKGIGIGSTVDIQNATPIGTATRLIVTNNTWTLVDVLASGSYKTN